MGGYGSTRWFFHSRKHIVDSYMFMDVNKLKRDGLFKQGTSFSMQWTDKQGKELISLGAQFINNHLQLSYWFTPKGLLPEFVSYGIPVEWTPCNFGGERAWFICPIKGCWHRVTKLYLIGKYFRCRYCGNLGYYTQRLNKSSRLREKADNIRRRLGGKPGLLNRFPDRPKGMHQKTYNKLWRELLRIEQAELLEMKKLVDNMKKRNLLQVY